MSDRFCEVQHDGIALVLVITVDPNDATAELIVSKDHFTKDRTYTSQEFASVEAAKAHCATKYEVDSAKWVDSPVFDHEFRFNFSVTNWGIPQPYTLGFESPALGVRVSPAAPETDGLPAQPTTVEITGNPAGLRRLAAELLLSADSERYDPEFHIHMNNPKSNLELTIRAPGYMRRFQEEGQGELALIYEE